MPCLNEALTLPGLLAECEKTLGADPNHDWQIVVADNGSTDGSIEIAHKAHATVVDIPRRGYGSAVHGGITSAGTEWVVYADADGTYPPKDAIRLLEAAIREDADMVTGSRFKGNIHVGAMPFLHRYLGTPVLSALIRWLHGVQITDCNSGIRCVKVSSYTKWRMRARGMEFASSLLIRASNAGAKIIEVPVSLRKSRPTRVPHMKSWKDGMRNLLVVLAGAPWFFWKSGLLLLALSLALGIPCVWGARPLIGRFGLFGPHTLAVATLIGFYGAWCINVALQIYARYPVKREQPWAAKVLTQLPEDVLFWSLVGIIGAFTVGFSYIFWRWLQVHFGTLDYTVLALFLVYFTVIPVTLVFGVFQSHLERRIES